MINAGSVIPALMRPKDREKSKKKVVVPSDLKPYQAAFPSFYIVMFQLFLLVTQRGWMCEIQRQSFGCSLPQITM